MYRFEHPIYFYGLLLIPLLSVFFILMRRRRAAQLANLGELGLIVRLMPQVSRIKHQLKFVVLMLVIALLVTAWANPQMGTRREKVQRKSADVMIALDVSESMRAQDVSPSRMERARSFLLGLTQRLRGERIGLIVFAGNAYLQMPLTSDYTAAALFIKTANPDMVPTQGTSIGDAINIARRALGRENKHHRALIIVTDGETHDEDAKEQAAEAADDNMILFTVGVGTEQGGEIPYDYGNGTADLKRDAQGEPIITKLNEPLLRDLAKIANGQYFNLNDSENIIASLQKQVERLDKTAFEARMFNEFETYYQYALVLALLLLVWEFLIPYRKSAFEDKDIFSQTS